MAGEHQGNHGGDPVCRRDDGGKPGRHPSTPHQQRIHSPWCHFKGMPFKTKASDAKGLFLSRIVHNSPFKSDTAQQVIFICEFQDDVYVKLEADGMSPRISLQEVAAASGRPRGCVYFR